MNMLAKNVTVKAMGTIREVHCKELIKENGKELIQESYITYFLGVPVRTSIQTRKPGLRDAVAAAMGVH